MTMPVELHMEFEETSVIGDVNAFIAYCEDGRAYLDWCDRIAVLTEEWDAFLREHHHVWQHIIIDTSR